MKLTNKIVEEIAKEIGFNLVGFAKAEHLTAEVDKLKKWLDENYQASMKYMEKNVEKREDVSLILEDAKSVIALGVNYYHEGDYSGNPEMGKISRYAWGKDYHNIIWEMLEKLESKLNSIDSAFKSKSYVDTGPVMDKAWAVRAGLGWMGKHSNIINRKFGSWFFIANIITNYEFEYDEPVEDYCGTCTACIDACPTNAIVADYVVDSNKCISFLTIENKGEISEEFKSQFDNWLFGCDICQDVCPWNKKFSIVSKIDEFKPVHKELLLSEVLKMDKQKFNEKFSESPVKRAKLSGLKRNARFLTGSDEANIV